MTAENVHMAPEIRPPTVQFQLSWSESVYVKVCRSNTCYADPACYLEPSTYNIIDQLAFCSGISPQIQGMFATKYIPMAYGRSDLAPSLH